MNKSKLSNGDSIDVVVVGSGLAGLLASAFLLQKNRSVLLLEKTAKAGGRFSPEKRDGFSLGAGFQFAKAELWQSALRRLGIDHPSVRLESARPLQHTNRGWQPFEEEEVPAWEAYLSRGEQEYPEGGHAGFCEALLSYCEKNSNFKMLYESPLTGLKIEAGCVTKAAIAADTEVSVKECVWAADFKNLLETLQGESVPEPGPERVSWLRRFSKAASVPAVALEFAHKDKVSEFSENLLIPFPSGDKEERRFLVGAFTGNREAGLAPEGRNLSSWLLPLTEGEWGDNHETMKKIRSGRRLLEKAFPSFEGSLLFDRVVVLESSVSPLGRKKGDWKKPYENLSVVSDWASPYGATPDGVITNLLENF